MEITIRDFSFEDKDQVMDICAQYWNDPSFLDEISTELDSYLTGEKKYCRFIVAENEGEIIGLVGYRQLPEYLNDFARTTKSVELFIIASKYKRKGIGEKLAVEIIDVAKQAGHVEILLFSPTTHDESWGFYKSLGFENLGEITPPDDERGVVWDINSKPH